MLVPRECGNKKWMRSLSPKTTWTLIAVVVAATVPPQVFAIVTTTSCAVTPWRETGTGHIDLGLACSSKTRRRRHIQPYRSSSPSIGSAREYQADNDGKGRDS